MNRIGTLVTTALCTTLAGLVMPHHAMAQGTTYTVCPVGCSYTSLPAAVAAGNVLTGSALPVDIQMTPAFAGVHAGGANAKGLIGPTVDTIIEYTGTINVANPDVVFEPTGQFAKTGNPSSQIGHPIVTLRNFGINYINATGNAGTCFQPQAGVLNWQYMSLIGDYKCNDGIEGNDWRVQQGTWDIENSYFSQLGGNSGPGHSLYCGFGTCIFNNDTIYNTVDGFGIKSRGTYTSITNCYISSDTPAGVVNPSGSSADIQIAQGGTAIITGNTLVFGLGTVDTATPPTVI